MKKTFLLFAFFIICCNLIIAQTGPKTVSGEVYFLVNTSAQPNKPRATSYKFNNQSFVSLAANWSPSAPAGFKDYWKAKYTVTETREGSGIGAPIFEIPVLNDTTLQAPPPTGTNGLQKGKVIDMTGDVEINKKVLKSLRGEHTSDNAYRLADSAQKVFNKKVTALDYEFLREDDWLFSEFIWREIDGREKFNQTFVFKGDDNSGDQRFVSILLNSIKNDSVWAFTEDRFTERMNFSQITSKLNGPMDTSFKKVKDFNGDLIRVDTVLYFNAEKGIPLDAVYKFRLKEQWVFDKESSRLYCRILGICPIAVIEKKDGKDRNGNDSTYMEDVPLFWIYYPDLRNVLAVKKVYNPNSYAGRGTWDALFEDHRYTGRIIKTSYDNPKSKYIQELVKNPLFRLLEGENIKTRIFNYEQSLWSY